MLGDGGLALPGASVELTSTDSGGATVTVSSAADGRWAADVPDGSYAITFSHPVGGYVTEQFDNHLDGRFFSWPSSVGVRGQDVPSVDAQLVRRGSVSGRIVRHGVPVDGATIQLEGVIAGQDLRSAQSGPDGRFTFDVVPGLFTLVYSVDAGEGAGSATDVREVDVPSGAHVDLDDLPLADASARGSVELTAVGGSVSDIRLMSSDDPITPVATSNGVSPGQPGLFTLRPGTYKIVHGWSNFGWLPNSWVGGRSFFSARSVFVRAGEVTRVSVSSSGEPMDEAAHVLNTRFQGLVDITVLLRRTDRPDEVVASAQTDGAGLYRFDALPQGDYLLTFVDPVGRYATTTIPLDPDALNIVLKRRQEPQLPSIDDDAPDATLRVASRGARPVRDVTLYRADDGAGRQHTERSDTADGSLLTARPGTYKVRLSAAHWFGGRSFSTATPVSLTSGAVTDIAVGSLPTTGDLVGSAAGVDGVRVKDAAAMIFAADTPGELIAVAPVRGRFIAEDLPRRPYKIRIDDPTGRYASAWVGGGDSFSTAPSFVPEISEETQVGSATLSRRTGPAPWEVPAAAEAPVASAPTALRALARPRVKGAMKVGRTLRAVTPPFNRPPATYERAWYRDGRRIGGATLATYRLKKKDARHRITFRLRARAGDGQAVEVSSRPTRRIASRS